MSKMDNTSFLPIFNHSHLKAVPGQNSLSGVSHIFLMLSNSDSLVTLQGGSERLFKIADL